MATIEQYKEQDAVRVIILHDRDADGDWQALEDPDGASGGGVIADTELPPAVADGDNKTPASSPTVFALNYVFDGATWDRWPGNSTDGALVNLGTNNDVDTELTTKDYDTGAGTDTVAVTGLLLPAAGGAVAAPGDTANGLDVDVTRVGGTVTTTRTRPSTGTRTSVSGSASSVTILAANANRLAATIYNDSTATLYLDLSGGTASSSNYSVQLTPNSYYELADPCYTGLITGIWSSAAGAAKVTEFT